MSKLYNILGINDDQDTCDLCGKTGLARVVWLENTETQEVIACGTTCAAKLQKISVKEQKKAEKDFEKEQRAKAAAELRPFERANDAVIKAAPNGDYSERMAFIRSHPDHVAYKAKKVELRERYGFYV